MDRQQELAGSKAGNNWRSRTRLMWYPILDELAWKACPHVAFTALSSAWRRLSKKVRSILDVGCGKGRPMKWLNRGKRFFTVGADAFKPYIRECKNLGIHDEYVLCDARRLPFQKKSFDAVLCLEVLEHLEKEDGLKLIRSIEEIAEGQVIISTPVGIHIRRYWVNGNPYQEHKAQWNPTELKRLGYKVRGVGLSNIGGEEGLLSRLPKYLHPWCHIVWVLAGPFVYFFPKSAGIMVCTKNKVSGDSILENM